MSDENVERLVVEARAEAETEVKQLLKSAIKATLLQRAMSRLGERSEAEDQTDISQLDDSNTPQRPETALYFYCITRSSAGVPDQASGVSQSPIQAIGAGELQALVSPVLPSDLDAQDSPRVERNIRAHDNVVKAAFDLGPIIPLRFGTVLRDEQAVCEVLETHHDRISDALALLHDKKEWGVKVRLSAQANAEACPASGREYLRQKADQGRLARARDVARLAEELHRALSAAVVDTTLLPTREKEIVLNAAYLVENSEESRFHDLLETLEDRLSHEDLRIEVSGPWPPYNFVNLDLSLQRAN